MSQNVISLALSADQLAEVNKALDMLEKNFTELICKRRPCPVLIPFL